MTQVFHGASIGVYGPINIEKIARSTDLLHIILGIRLILMDPKMNGCDFSCTLPPDRKKATA